MPYLIDSDVVIDHLADVPVATKLLEKLATDGIAVSIITYMEAYQGVLRSPHQTRARKQFEALLETVPVLPFSPSIAKRCAQLRETLHREGKRVKARALDLITAGYCHRTPSHPRDPQCGGLSQYPWLENLQSKLTHPSISFTLLC